MSDSKALVPYQRGIVASVGRQLAITEKLLPTGWFLQHGFDVFCVPRDGSIEDAVEKVRPGGTIRIAKGQYVVEQGIFH